MTPEESDRLRLLDEYNVLDSGPDPDLDALVELASAICETPVALVTLVDASRQWFKARVGLDVEQTPREIAFCAHTVESREPGLFTVRDARQDPRFADNPLVKGEPHVVFYAGAPLVVEEGHRLGTLCVVDKVPRDLTPLQRQTLETLSRTVVRHLQLRRAERVARERQALLDAREREVRELDRLFDLSIDLFCSNQNGYFVRVNPAFERTLGWSARELTAVPINDFVHPDDLEATVARRNAVAAGIMLNRFENRLRHKNGAYRWISWSAVSEGAVTYAVGRDVTAEKADLAARANLLEEQRAARELAEHAASTMDQFLATVSHELRTPLNAMLGWTRLLRGEKFPESQRAKALETIERNATAQTQLIEDLLDVSRIISGKMRLDVAIVDLVAVIEAALDVVRPAADAKGVRLNAVLDPSASHVAGDSARLQQVVWNLLANAVKFTPRGGSVELRLMRVESSVDIVVSDTGKGISSDFLPHVFERFRQADGATTRAHGGLGLGLAIVKNIAELHGGTVSVESQGTGRGSTFCVRLPLSLIRSHTTMPSEPPPSRAEVPMAWDRPAEIAGLKVLVVDDETDARELMVTMLGQRGARVTSVASAADALAALARVQPDVVVSDLGMPDEDGYSLIRKIRALSETSGGRVPAIALTAYARAEDRTRALRAGFNTHLAKPIEPSELLAVIASVTGRH